MENLSNCQLLNKPIVAAFDFDGTMTKHDSLYDFFKYSAGSLETYFIFLQHLPKFIGFGLKIFSRKDLKESLFKSFFKGMSIADLRLKGEDFANNVIPKLLKKESIAKLKWHQEQGHRCILVSANMDVYLDYFTKNNQFDDCLCTKAAFDEKGLVTGYIQGKNCRGEEKVHRLTELLGSKENYTLYAYGDSDGDKELLELADYPFYRVFKS